MVGLDSRATPLPGISPGREIGIGFKTSPQAVDWVTLSATWAAAGELDAFDSAWMNDHLMNTATGQPGASFESLTAVAALAHSIPGKWVGHSVLSNTFRHPAVVAKAATVMDHVTEGRFILGIGAGWHEREHTAFGIALPQIRERIDRFDAAVRVLRALFAPEAAFPPGVSLQDPYYPLVNATNEPAPTRPGGPPVWLGGQKPRGLDLAATQADGWFMSGEHANDANYLGEKRGQLVRRLEAAGRDPDAFAFVGQISGGGMGRDRRETVEAGAAMIRAGATHVIIGVDPSQGPEGVRLVAREIAEPLLEVPT